MRVSVFGIGKVGISLIATLLRAGHQVIGVDTNVDLVDRINENRVSFNEPSVQDILDRLRDKLEVTVSAAEAIDKTDISFIIVPTESNTEGGFSNRHVLASLENIGVCLALKTSFHTVVVMSTVVPGSSVYQLIPALENASHKKVGKEIGYCYNPLFIAQGEIVKGIVTPDYILIGESCSRSGDLIEALHASVLENQAPVVRMNTTEAEITKLASNTHETMRVSFANMLAQTCHEMPGTSVDNVTNALSFRLGKRFFKGATPYGGPCWPRDNIALSSLLNAIGLQAPIPESVHQFNRYHSDYLIGKIQQTVDRGNTHIGLIGLAYKPGTPLIDESFAVDIVEKLRGDNLIFIAHDPLAADAFRSRFPEKQLEITDDAEQCLAQDLCLLLLPLDIIQTLNFSKFRNTIIMDFWRALPKSASETLENYIPFGVNQDESQTERYANAIKQLTK